MKPAVTVIVPTYNRHSFLEAALASVVAQSTTDFECIVVDDASSEQVRVPRDDRFHLLRLRQNVGCSAARLAGLAAASGAAVAFLDDDDVMSPERLALGLRGLDCAPVSVVWRHGLGDTTQRPGRQLNGDCRDVILDGYTPHLGQTMVRADELVPFDPTWTALEDVEWWLRMAHKAHIYTLPTHAYSVRSHSGPRSGNGKRARLESSLRLLKEHAQYFRSHPHARAFRHERVAAMLREEGRYGEARHHLRQSLSARPDVPNLARLVLACRRDALLRS